MEKNVSLGEPLMNDPNGEPDVHVLAVVVLSVGVHHADDAVVTTDVDLAAVDRRRGGAKVRRERVEEPPAAVGVESANDLLVHQVRPRGRR